MRRSPRCSGRPAGSGSSSCRSPCSPGWRWRGGPWRDLPTSARVVGFALVAAVTAGQHVPHRLPQRPHGPGRPRHAADRAARPGRGAGRGDRRAGRPRAGSSRPLRRCACRPRWCWPTRLAWRRVGERAGPPAPLRPLLGYGLRSLPGTLSNLATNRLDQVLIAPMLGTRALGLYAVAVGITFVPVQVGAGLAFAAFRRVRPADPAGPERPGRARCCGGPGCSWARPAWPPGWRRSPGSSSSTATTSAPPSPPTLLLLPAALFLGLHLVLTQVANALGCPEHASAGQVAGRASSRSAASSSCCRSTASPALPSCRASPSAARVAATTVAPPAARRRRDAAVGRRRHRHRGRRPPAPSSPPVTPSRAGSSRAPGAAGARGGAGAGRRGRMRRAVPASERTLSRAPRCRHHAPKVGRCR